VLFDETQRPGQWWLWALVTAACGVPVVIMLWPVSRQPQVWPQLTFVLLPASLPLVLLALVRLRVTVTSTEVVISLVPFRRRYPIDEVATWEPTDYRPIREFGGWGIRWSLRDSTTAYTMQGNRGVRIVTTKGKKLLIGSQRPEDLAAAIAAAKGT
jgi:hypothetical protein